MLLRAAININQDWLKAVLRKRHWEKGSRKEGIVTVGAAANLTKIT